VQDRCSVCCFKFCEETSPISFQAGFARAGGEAEVAAAGVLLRANLPAAFVEKLTVLVASPLEVLQAALPSLRSVSHGPECAGALGASAAGLLVLADDAVQNSGALRPGVLEDLALLWRFCRGGPLGDATPGGLQLHHRVHVVPEAVLLHVTLVESVQLARRASVVEAVSGLDVSRINVLSVPMFLDMDEAEVMPRRLSVKTEALVLPLGSPTLLTVLDGLSVDGGRKASVRLTVTSTGRAHAVLTEFVWTGSSTARADVGAPEKLAGVMWPMANGEEPPIVDPGDVVELSIGYSPARGLIVQIASFERRRGR